MKCLSFGFLIVYIILVALVSSMASIVLPHASGALNAVAGIVNLGLIIWFIVGFFNKCDAPQQY